MKRKKLAGKLSLNKTTISDLMEKSMDEVKGGKRTTIVPNTKMTYCYCSWVYSCDFATCDPTLCGDHCV